MNIKGLIYLYILGTVLVCCSNSDTPDIPDHKVDLNAVSLASPKYITTRVGEVVEFQLNTGSISGLSYSWKCDGKQFSTEQNPSMKVDKHGLFAVEVIVKEGTSGFTKAFKSEVFVAKNSKYKSVAYFPSWRSYTGNNWDKITHVFLCFGEVKSDGSINVDEVKKSLSSTITKAHENGVYVLLSLGGGTETNGFTEALLNELSRKKITESCLKVIDDLKIDGIDVDYEMWDYYESADNEKKSIELEKLFKELRSDMSKGSILSTAISPSYIRYKGIKASMIQYLDLVNLMIYDATGPWSGSTVGSHSSWDFFLSSIELAKQINTPNEKIIAGVPFYGYKFKSATSAVGAESIIYSDIVKQYPGAEDKNEISDAFLYYDGKPMIKQKSKYVVDNKLGGIMFWEITQDSDIASKSLLEVIDSVLEISAN